MAQYRKLQRCLQYWPWSLAALQPRRGRAPRLSLGIRYVRSASGHRARLPWPYEHSLVVATYAHIGRNVSDPDKRFAGNNLVRAKRHLKASLKKLAGLNWANGRRQRSHKISRPFSF
jgi:hypothetical protein